MDWTAVGVIRGRELCNIYYKKLENVPGKSGVCQGEVREKSGKFCCQSLWEPCNNIRLMYEVKSHFYAVMMQP